MLIVPATLEKNKEGSTIQKALAASASVPESVSACLNKAQHLIQEAQENLDEISAGDVSSIIHAINIINDLIKKSVDLSISYQRERLSDVLSSYKDRMDNSQHPIIADEGLSISAKFNLLIHSASRLAIENSEVLKVKHDLKAFSDELQHLKGELNEITDHVGHLTVDIQHAPPQIQKLPNSKQCISQLLQAEAVLVRGIQKNIHAMHSKASPVAELEFAEEAMKHIDTARSEASHHGLTATALLTQAASILTKKTDILESSTKVTHGPLEELITSTKALHRLTISLIKNDNPQSCYDASYQAAIIETLQAVNTHSKAVKHGVDLENTLASQPKKRRIKETARAEFLVACHNSLHTASEVASPFGTHKESAKRKTLNLQVRIVSFFKWALGISSHEEKGVVELSAEKENLPEPSVSSKHTAKILAEYAARGARPGEAHTQSAVSSNQQNYRQ